jgi:hypothetical protein
MQPMHSSRNAHWTKIKVSADKKIRRAARLEMGWTTRLDSEYLALQSQTSA